MCINVYKICTYLTVSSRLKCVIKRFFIAIYILQFYCYMTCFIEVASPINLSIFSQLDILPFNVKGDLSNYQKNGEFHLENYTVIKHSIIYSCCPDAPFPDLTYYVVLRRRPMFYVFNLILPCVLINGIGKGMLHSNLYQTSNKDELQEYVEESCYFGTVLYCIFVCLLKIASKTFFLKMKPSD